MGFFKSSNKSGDTLAEEGSAQRASRQHVTDYSSFAEYRSNNQGDGSANSRNTDPVSLTSSHEVLLEDQRNLNENRYRGFSSSMHDMYSSTEFERVDCCAMTCGGMLQSDRDRYLIHGITPPSIARRFWLHIALPTCLFTLAASGAMRIQDRFMNQAFTTGIISILFAYLMVQCYKGRSKRIEIRKDLLWTKAQLQENRNQNLTVLLEQNAPDDLGEEQQYYLGQSQRDFGCAHPCCLIGCYAEDRAAYELRFSRDDEQADNERQVARDKRRRRNLSRCLWDYACPTIWCGHQLQCCGICALAQEAREVESAILPASYRRIDYISMQPISHYYPAIYKRRHCNNAGGDGVFREEATVQDLINDVGLNQPSTAEDVEQSNESSNSNTREPKFILSNLSKQLIQFALTITSLVFVWCLIGKIFWKYALNLAVPAWRVFRLSDFIVYLGTWAQAIILMYIVNMLCNKPCPTHLSLDAMIKFFAAGFCLSTALAVFWEIALGGIAKAMISVFIALSGVDVIIDEDGYTSNNNVESTWMRFGAGTFARTIEAGTNKGDYFRAYGNAHPVFYTFYIAFTAFCLAAFVEEACKYFGYRMIEHPDFMTQREIEDAMTVVIQQGRDGEDDDEEEEEEARQRREARRRRQQRDLEQVDFSKQKKSVQSLGGAITLAMVCTAIGFGCCENLIYIFIYSGSSLGAEIYILLARSLFPIHPIAAAMQSIRVIERDVEVTRTAALASILGPAVLFHGTYDFFILWIDFLSQRNGNYLNSNTLAGFLTFVMSVLIMGSALLYYFTAASRQRSRLQVTDESVEAGQSVLI